jgi:uncharacterized membrane protein YidH (DUF202 family)
MAGRTLIAVLLIVVGLTGLMYGGLTYTRTKKIVDLGPIEVTKDEHERVPLPPIVGGLLLVSGVWLLVAGRSRSA